MVLCVFAVVLGGAAVLTGSNYVIVENLTLLPVEAAARQVPDTLSIVQCSHDMPCLVDCLVQVPQGVSSFVHCPVFP